MRILIFIMFIGAVFTSFATSRPYQRGVEAYTAKRYSQAYEFLKQAAKEENTDAMYLLGKMCSEGHCPGSNSRKIGMHWLEEAARYGVKEAKQILEELQAESYLNEDVLKAISNLSLEEAVEELDATGQVDAPQDLLKGLIAFQKKKHRQAARLFRKAAQGGEATAMAYLGTMYLEGKGTFKSKKQALFWFTESAKQRNPVAMYYLGTLYEQGDGVKRSYGKAVMYYKSAARMNYPEALYKLAKITYEGRLVKKNSIAAYNLANTAASNGHQLASKFASLIFNNMSEEQRDALWTMKQEGTVLNETNHEKKEESFRMTTKQREVNQKKKSNKFGVISKGFH